MGSPRSCGGVPMPRLAQKALDPEVSNWRILLIMPFAASQLTLDDARGVIASETRYTSPTTNEEIVAEETSDAVTAATAATMPRGRLAPVFPVANAAASKRLLASPRSRASSLAKPESAVTSYEPNTHAAAF